MMGSSALATTGASCARASSTPEQQHHQEQQRQEGGTGASTRGPGTPVRSVEQHERECWSCQHNMQRGSFACQGCEKIQPIDTTLNYFELMGMPNLHFELDLGRLERQYKLLQWSLHPDKVVLRPKDEQAYAAQQATLVNHAYSILRQPLSRANYILSLVGIHAGEGFEGTIHDKELLMEIMEAREEVESTEDAQELRKILDANLQQQAGVVGALADAFRRKAYQDAVPLATHLTYLAKLEHEVRAKLPS